MKDFLKNLCKQTKNACIHYPISFGAIITLFMIWQYIIWFGGNLSYEIINSLGEINLSLILLIILSLGAYSFKTKTNIYKILAMIFSVLFTIIFYYSLPNLDSLSHIQIYYIFVVFTISFALLILSGYEKNNDNFFVYIMNLFEKVIKTVIISLIALIAGYIAFGAIDMLFNLNFSNIYKAYFVFIFVLFAGIFFIGELQTWKEKFSYSKLCKLLIIYVIIPAIFIYFIILTIYDIKLLFSLPNWPSRMAPYLIIMFSLIGYFVYIITYKLEEGKIFKKWFPILVLIQLPVLFISIYLRINQYDLTFNRYLLIVFFIFLLLASVYFTFSKNKNIAIIFILFMGILGITSIGPWSIENLPKQRQLNHLTKILKKNKLIVGNTFKLEKIKNSSDKTKQLIADKINYLCSNHNCKDIKVLKPIINEIEQNDKIKWGENKKNEILELKKGAWTDKDLRKIENKKYKGLKKWEIRYKLLKKLGIDNYYTSNKLNKYYKITNNKFQNIVDVFGYSYLILVGQEKYKNLYHNGYFITIDNKGFVYLYEDKKLVDKKQISQQKLKNIFSNTKQNLSHPIEIVFNMGVYEIKIGLYNFELIKKGDVIEFEYIGKTYGLLKRK